MLQKIVRFKNIKQLQHKLAPERNFDQLNLIYGRNGAGKSTICNIFDLLNDGNLSGIEDLKSVEAIDASQEVDFHLIFKDSNSPHLVVTPKSPTISPFKFHIFNQIFIDNNVHTSAGVDSSNLVNYYEFCLGSSSIEKQTKIAELKNQNEELTKAISNIEREITSQFNNRKNIQQIVKIKKIDDPDKKIEDLQEKIKDYHAEDKFRNRRTPAELKYYAEDLDFSIFKVSTEQLSAEAEVRVEAHIKENLKERDTSWLETGIKLRTDSGNCPFCAQPLQSSPIFHLFSEYMNESYRDAVSTFEIDSSEFSLRTYRIASGLEALEETHKENLNIVEIWSDKVQSMPLALDLQQQNKIATQLIIKSGKLIKLKEKDILAQIDTTTIEQIYSDLIQSIDLDNYNKEILSLNSKIKEFKDSLKSTDIEELKNYINEIVDSKIRHTSTIITSISEQAIAKKTRAANSLEISKLREEIETEQEKLIGRHEQCLNQLLTSFSSSIRIKKLGKDNKGKGGSSRFTYNIEFIDKTLSITDATDNKRLMSQILSNGDKSSLALAFFLSNFQNKNEDQSIIVLDDPMCSLDLHRRETTIREVSKLLRSGYQTFVLSHDAHFLSDIKNYSNLSEKTKCFELEIERIDKNPYDENSLKYCQSRIVSREDFEHYVLHSYQQEYKDLLAFITTPKEAQKTSIARSIRPILEAYLRLLLPEQFSNKLWLGEMIKRIRDETSATSQFFDKHNRLEDIEDINQFSKQYHHADGFDTKIQQLNLEEVLHFAKKTYRFITGLS